MHLARGLRMVLLAMTASILFVALSSSSPIRLYDRNNALAMKRDVNALAIGESSTSAPGPAPVDITPAGHPSALVASLADSSAASTLASGANLDANTANSTDTTSPQDASAAVVRVTATALNPASNSSTAAISLPAAPGNAADATVQRAPSTSQQTFPSYGDYQGNVTESTYHPFLAEVDTLFSHEQMREYGPAPYETRYRALDDSDNKFDVLKHWANLSPYYSSPLYPEVQKYKAMPSQCKLKQVHMLHR